MIIEESDFRLIPVNESSFLFDLELLKVINKGKENERTEFQNEGYGYTLESAIHKIIMYRINNKRRNETISLKEFRKELKDERSKIEQIFKN